MVTMVVPSGQPGEKQHVFPSFCPGFPTHQLIKVVLSVLRMKRHSKATNIWVNYNDLTATSLEIMVNKGNHPQMALIQVREILQFTQKYGCSLLTSTVLLASKVVPSLAKVIAKPGFIHSATPDMWVSWLIDVPSCGRKKAAFLWSVYWRFPGIYVVYWDMCIYIWI